MRDGGPQARPRLCGLEEHAKFFRHVLGGAYRSDARFESAFWQIRSSSPGIVSSIWRGGRGSDVMICSITSIERITSERFHPGQQLVENDAETEDVGSPVNPVTFAPGLLGAHVGRACRRSRPLAEIFVREGEPEVGHAGFA